MNEEKKDFNEEFKNCSVSLDSVNGLRIYSKDVKLIDKFKDDYGSYVFLLNQQNAEKKHRFYLMGTNFIDDIDFSGETIEEVLKKYIQHQNKEINYYRKKLEKIEEIIEKE